MSTNDFFNKYNGKEVTDPWGTYKGECVSLVKMWIKENGWPMRRGNAINWQYNGTPPYKWFVNYPWSVPQPGDMPVFKVGQYGHIGIVMSASSRSMQVFSQNWPTGKDVDPARVATFDYVRPKCIGWLRHI